MGFVYLFLYFVMVDNAITLFNCFFHDFCRFCDFRVIDLAITVSQQKFRNFKSTLIIFALCWSEMGVVLGL